MSMPSPFELLVILIFVVLLFGAKRIPEIARALGKASKEFKKAKDDIVNDTEKIISESDKKSEEGEYSDSKLKAEDYTEAKDDNNKKS